MEMRKEIFKIVLDKRKECALILTMVNDMNKSEFLNSSEIRACGDCLGLARIVYQRLSLQAHFLKGIEICV